MRVTLNLALAKQSNHDRNKILTNLNVYYKYSMVPLKSFLINCIQNQCCYLSFVPCLTFQRDSIQTNFSSLPRSCQDNFWVTGNLNDTVNQSLLQITAQNTIRLYEWMDGNLHGIVGFFLRWFCKNKMVSNFSRKLPNELTGQSSVSQSGWLHSKTSYQPVGSDRIG